MTEDNSTHHGGCHCGRVRFAVMAPAAITAYECNCSICRMTAYLHLIVRKSDFRLECGEDELTTYTFNTGIARHYFCRHCGIKPFYVPRSNPDGISVNVRCLDPATVSSTRLEPFDGSHWESQGEALRDLTA